jgi:hypothetical protein
LIGAWFATERAMRVSVLLSVLVSAATTVEGQTAATRPRWTAESLRNAVRRSVAASACPPGGAVRTDEGEVSEDKHEREDGIIHRLSRDGTFVLLGHSVQIVGGLVPSANIAAQAGGLDPTQAAIAAVGGVGTVQQLHFRVEPPDPRRPSTGPCF